MPFVLDDILLAAMLTSALVGAGAKGAKSYKEGKYGKKLENMAEEEKRKAEIERKRAALARALQLDMEFLPQSEREVPQPPSMAVEDVIGGLSDVAGQTAGAFYGKGKTPEAKTKTKAPYQAKTVEDIYRKYGLTGGGHT